MEKNTKNNKFIFIILTLLIIGSVYGIFKYNHSLSHEETDDAQIQKNMNPIIPKISGYVQKV
jgi:membrane fusion protein (multidrug efflux system)